MGKNWTQEELETCLEMIGKNEPMDVIAKEVNRTENAVIQRRRRFVYDDMKNNVPTGDLEKKYNMTKEELEKEFDLEVKSIEDKKEKRKQTRKNNNVVSQTTAVTQNVNPQTPVVKQKETYTLTQKMEMYNFVCSFEQNARLNSYRDKLYYNIMREIDSYLR